MGGWGSLVSWDPEKRCIALKLHSGMLSWKEDSHLEKASFLSHTKTERGIASYDGS